MVTPYFIKYKNTAHEHKDIHMDIAICGTSTDSLESGGEQLVDGGQWHGF